MLGGAASLRHYGPGGQSHLVEAEEPEGLQFPQGHVALALWEEALWEALQEAQREALWEAPPETALRRAALRRAVLREAALRRPTLRLAALSRPPTGSTPCRAPSSRWAPARGE